jgi:hypothetical protein
VCILCIYIYSRSIPEFTYARIYSPVVCSYWYSIRTYIYSNIRIRMIEYSQYVMQWIRAYNM